MQVFKLYFKVFNKYKGQIFMYVGIFMGILLGAILPNAEKQTPSDFTNSKTKYAIYDYDNSELSSAVKEYLSDTHEKKELRADDEEIIQDALYNMEVGCVVRILDGYEDAFKRGNVDEYIKVYRIPGMSMSILFEEDLRSYLSTVSTYLISGYSIEESVEKAQKVQEKSIDVTLANGETVNENSSAHWFFTYMPWLFVAICVSAIGPVLVVLDKKNIRDRIECSAYKFSKMNKEIILAVLVTGAVICTMFVVLSIFVAGKDMKPVTALLYFANSYCNMGVALSITYLISKLTDKNAVISLLSNVIGLGMSFLGGVFVPLQYLSDTVVKIAHFLPTYWYEKAVICIDGYTSNNLTEIAGYMGIQVLFAVAILVVGVAISNKRRVA